MDPPLQSSSSILSVFIPRCRSPPLSAGRNVASVSFPLGIDFLSLATASCLLPGRASCFLTRIPFVTPLLLSAKCGGGAARLFMSNARRGHRPPSFHSTSDFYSLTSSRDEVLGSFFSTTCSWTFTPPQTLLSLFDTRSFYFAVMSYRPYFVLLASSPLVASGGGLGYLCQISNCPRLPPALAVLAHRHILSLSIRRRFPLTPCPMRPFARFVLSPYRLSFRIVSPDLAHPTSIPLTLPASVF